MNRAPFGLPSISPSGIPLREQTGAIPSVFIDDDDSNDAHLGEADTGQIEIFTETNKGDQE